MTPKKPSTSGSVSAGAGMITRSISQNRATTHQPTTTRVKSKAQASITNPAPVTQSSRPGKAARIHKSSSTKSASAKKIKANQASRRKKAALDMLSSSPVASSSDVEAGPSTQPKVAATHKARDLPSANEPVHPKVAAFHEARGLSFEQLYIQSDDAGSSSDAAPNANKQPQTNSDTATKATGAAVASKRPKRTSIKRALDNDDSEEAAGAASSCPTPPAKRLKLKLKKPSNNSFNKRPAESDENDAPPAKRLFLSSDEPVPSTEASPTAAASTVAAPIASAPDAAAPDIAASGNNGKAKAKGAPVITKNGKVKKTPEYAVEHAFDGTASGHGTSVERPEYGTLEKPWSCANLNCSTGMTWVPRNHKDSKSGKGPMGRKVISQFFGRNKGPTKLIPNDVWHFFCRKDYQRTRYAAEHGSTHDLSKYVITNLRAQLIRLKLWRPDALFQVQLDKGATDRLNAYFAALREHNNNEAASLASLPGPKDPKKEKPEEIFPPSLSETFNRRFKTAGKTATANYDDIEAIIVWSEGEITAGRSKAFVPCEFLINPIQPGETVNDLGHNFAQWEVIHRDNLQAEAEAAAAAAADAASDESTSGTSSPDDAVSRNIKSSPAPSTKKASELKPKGKGKANFIKPDPDQTEVNSDGDDDDDEPVTPTPAPRNNFIIQADRNDPMSLMRVLNDVAEDMGYHARSDTS